jgi:hypothetical protein
VGGAKTFSQGEITSIITPRFSPLVSEWYWKQGCNVNQVLAEWIVKKVLSFQSYSQQFRRVLIRKDVLSLE